MKCVKIYTKIYEKKQRNKSLIRFYDFFMEISINNVYIIYKIQKKKKKIDSTYENRKESDLIQFQIVQREQAANNKHPEIYFRTALRAIIVEKSCCQE